jgi:transcriptional regulator with XRE-family HTH domain|tara:strand:+ start:427 stop:591 length:165 start_codon:yes stop_codon:yes gene_type:complete
MSGISSNTIENYERRKIKEPSIYKVEQILNAMGYDLDAIKVDDDTTVAPSRRQM